MIRRYFKGFQFLYRYIRRKFFYEAKTDYLKTDYIEERKFELTIIYKRTPPPHPGQRKLTLV